MKKECPKCKGEMKQGRLMGVQADWQKDGEQRFLKNDSPNIITYACQKCGYLESYVRN